MSAKTTVICLAPCSSGTVAVVERTPNAHPEHKCTHGNDGHCLPLPDDDLPLVRWAAPQSCRWLSVNRRIHGLAPLRMYRRGRWTARHFRFRTPPRHLINPSGQEWTGRARRAYHGRRWQIIRCLGRVIWGIGRVMCGVDPGWERFTWSTGAAPRTVSRLPRIPFSTRKPDSLPALIILPVLLWRHKGTWPLQ